MTYSKCREELATCGGSNMVKVWNEFTHQTKYILKGDPKEEILMVGSHFYEIKILQKYIQSHLSRH